MLHRLRRAMVRPARQLLTGEVEIDESYLALTDRKKPLNKQGRKSNTSKILVAIAVEIKEPKGFGRIRIQQIEKGDSENLMSFIRASVDPDANIHSDGSGAYLKLQEEGCGHRRTVHLGSVFQRMKPCRCTSSCRTSSALATRHSSWRYTAKATRFIFE